MKQALPHTDLNAVELRDLLAKILLAKGHAVVGRDFTAWNGNGRQYDRVLMNPPFKKGADMAHVWQAFNHVKASGWLSPSCPTASASARPAEPPASCAWLEETTRRTHGGSEADTVRRAISYRGPVPLGGGELPSDSTVWR